MRYQITNIEHLKAKLAELRDDPTKHWSEYPCLEWDRGRHRNGYGQIGWRINRTRLVHRAAYELIHGQLPGHIDACHHCDVRLCFRPIHLFAGSRSDNIRDCVAKGRNRYTVYPGAKNHAAKLTDEQVLQIRSISGMSHQRIAELYSVSQVLISRIIRRAGWRHI